MTRSDILARFRGARLSRLDHLAFVLLVAGALALAGEGWLDAHPGDNPWAPLDLRDEPGWTTARKIAALRGDAALCRAVLERSDVEFAALDPAGEGACLRADRLVLSDAPLSPGRPPTTCSVAAAFQVWLERGVRPAAREAFDAELARIEHFGAYSCRRLYGRADGRWSEHATGNAIDIAAFVLADGTRISVAGDWDADNTKAAFLRRVHAAACGPFGTVLGPDYNAAHRDHFHLDQAARGFGSVCR